MAIENVLRGAVLLLALASCRGWPDHDDNTIESRLATWLLNHPGAELVIFALTPSLLPLLLLFSVDLQLPVSAAASWHTQPDCRRCSRRRIFVAAIALQNGMAVGRECPTCLRGIVATKDFAYEDVIGRFPLVAMQIFP